MAAPHSNCTCKNGNACDGHSSDGDSDRDSLERWAHTTATGVGYVKQPEATPIRALLADWVDDVRAAANRKPVSAAGAARRRRRAHYLVMAAWLRMANSGVQSDNPVLQRVTTAVVSGVRGTCRYCGCSFSVVPVVEIPGQWTACGVCGRRVPTAPPDQPEGWVPW